jgi:hypothetical protein
LNCGFDCFFKNQRWLEKVKKGTLQNTPPRQRESPRRSGSSVQEHSDDRVVLPTSPQAGNEEDTGNIHVSPHDESLDSQVNNDVGSDSVEPELLFNWRTQ